MLLTSNLSLKRDQKVIFEDINISASPGKIIFIKGENGAGKTSLIKSLVNILSVNDGDIFWMGKNIKKNIFEYYNAITLILDKPTSAVQMTVLENINFWKKISNSKISNEGINNLLNMLELDQYLDRQVMYLSLGEIKKLELTRLILEQKKIWIIDEPFSNLDSKSIIILNDTFIDHVSNNGVIIFSSHNEPDLINLEIVSLNKL